MQYRYAIPTSDLLDHLVAFETSGAYLSAILNLYFWVHRRLHRVANAKSHTCDPAQQGLEDLAANDKE